MIKKVVCAIIVKESKGKKKYLLVSSGRSFGKYSGFYYPPGGHVEKNESLLNALSREIKEELELKINSAELIAKTKGDIPNQITYWYLCEVDSYDFKLDKNELRNGGYYTKEEIQKMKIWPATMKMLKKYIF
ncbi:MAG: NUDIX hydrolase [Candidatus Omnitrophica bacterium]|nr:NUDIX hydrolase [Candidatus Omnitrophota bacterium]